MTRPRRPLFTALAVAAAAGLGSIGLRASDTRYYDGPPSDHFDGDRFFDPHGSPPKPPGDLLRWYREGGRATWPAWAPSPFSDRPPRRVDGPACRVVYVGHASLLIQTAGLNILLDPVWSQRASPFTFIGPKRVNNPGIAFDALPPIDAVLVSHGHYDHLDVATLSALVTSHRASVITPLGNDTIMQAHDRAIRATAADWGQRIVLSRDVAVTLAACRHWTARTPFDRNRALWAAFVIETPAGRIFHVGDSGYGNGHHFRDAREQHGPFRLAILPIGAYEPRWFMRDQHMNPEESVQAFLDSGADLALGHHYGTFQLTNEAIDAPVAALTAARAAASLAPEKFRVLKPGEAWEL